MRYLSENPKLIPQEVLAEPNLSARAKGIYALIAYSGGEVREEEIEIRCSETPEELHAALYELIRGGYVSFQGGSE